MSHGLSAKIGGEKKIDEIKYLDKDELIKRGKNVYKLLKPKLEKKFKGKVMAIEVDSPKERK